MSVDYIIVGQGLCGTLLSRELIKRGKTVLVIDDNNAAAAGRVAGGIINPVTGKRLVKSWMIDELLPFAAQYYKAIEEELRLSVLSECDLLDFHPTTEHQSLFQERLEADGQYLGAVRTEEPYSHFFRYNYGIGVIKQCLLVDLRKLLASWRVQLMQRGMQLNEHFDIAKMSHSNEGVVYGNVQADKVIFCDGAAGIDNPFFAGLPWSKDKGEALIVSIPDLPRNRMYRQGISIVPWGDNLFWVGASHDWKYTTTAPTESFLKSTTERLDYWLKLPYTVEAHITALRPANIDRRPFVGMHPVHSRIGIFNGMGGKGCSMAPWFATQFCNHLVTGIALMPDADVGRYKRVLSRE